MKKQYQILKVGNKIDIEKCEIRDRNKWYPVKDYILHSDRVTKDMKPIRVKIEDSEVVAKKIHTAKRPRRDLSTRVIIGRWKNKSKDEIKSKIKEYEHKILALRIALSEK